MVQRWNPTFKAFTFVETLVTIALLVVSAGLATMLLFSSLVFTQSHEAAEKRFRSLLALKVELTAATSRVQPAAWANPETTFVQEGSRWIMQYWNGVSDAQASLELGSDGRLRWVDPEGSAVWGPWAETKVAFWKKDDRVLGLEVTLADRGLSHTLKFAWGAWPL